MELAKKGCAELQKLAPIPPPMSWESRAQLREVRARTPSPEA